MITSGPNPNPNSHRPPGRATGPHPLRVGPECRSANIRRPHRPNPNLASPHPNSPRPQTKTMTSGPSPNSHRPCCRVAGPRRLRVAPARRSVSPIRPVGVHSNRRRARCRRADHSRARNLRPRRARNEAIPIAPTRHTTKSRRPVSRFPCVANVTTRGRRPARDLRPQIDWSNGHRTSHRLPGATPPRGNGPAATHRSELPVGTRNRARGLDPRRRAPRSEIALRNVRRRNPA